MNYRLLTQTKLITMKNELFLLDGFKVLGDIIRLTGEDESGKLYNVELSSDDFAAYFGIDTIEIEKEEEETIRDAANAIYGAWLFGHTNYEVTVVAQKLKGYRFECLSGKTQDLCFRVVGDIAKFMKNNINYTSYAPIFG